MLLCMVYGLIMLGCIKQNKTTSIDTGMEVCASTKLQAFLIIFMEHFLFQKDFSLTG